MHIARLDPRADDVRPFYDLHTTARRADDPGGPPTSYTDFRAYLIWGWSANAPLTWLGWSDDGTRLLGGYTLVLPSYDNSHLGMVDPVVHPALRRRGYGRTLFEHVSAQVRRAGRGLIAGDAREGSAGTAFGEGLGAERASVEVRSVQDLTAVGEDPIDELLTTARAAAPGYSVLSWLGETPERHLGDVARLLCAMSDAPADQLEWEGEVWDAGRVRKEGKAFTDSRVRAYTVVARHDASGRLVGHTRIFVSEEHHGWAHQGDTVVLPEHRGHRLGLLTKASMLRWLREAEPEIRKVVTGNAESNASMLRVNRALGYRPLDRSIAYQLRLA